MQIDFDENKNPHAMLVSFSPAEAPNPDGTFFSVFIPIQDILDLRDTDRMLQGHPWIDVPGENLIIQQLSRSDHKRLVRHVNAGRYIAIRAVPQRGKRSRGCRLDKVGQPIVKYHYGYRHPEKYLSEFDIFWLSAFSKVSAVYTDAFFAAIALGEFFQALSEKIAQMPRPKKPKLKAKERRQLARV
jgi:hypothetical protein